MKKIITSFISLFIFVISFAQVTLTPVISSTNTSPLTVFVFLSPDMTMFDINIRNFFIEQPYNWISISSTTKLSYVDPQDGKVVTLSAKKMTIGDLKDHMEPANFDTKYTIHNFISAQSNDIQIYFDSIPCGVTEINVYEDHVRRGYYWRGVQINPRVEYKSPSIATSMEDISLLLGSTKSEFAGIYEQVDEPSYQLAFLNKDGYYYLVYLDASEKLKERSEWELGEVKAEMRQSVAANIFKATWYMIDKSKKEGCIITFEPGIMRLTLGDEELLFMKMSRSDADIIQNNNSKSSTWSGSGFALKDGYIVTNNHVVEGAKTIKVYGIDGNSSHAYAAELIASDKNNDLAIIKINDQSFEGFTDIPYSVKTNMAEVGESIFVLGYPLTQLMGNEIKLTDGIISSRSGYQGDISAYQMTAPIQPGNSGGPMFDEKGNIVGIVNAGIQGADNVGYAIKTSYLKNLVDNISSSILPDKNLISALSLPQKVKIVKDYIFFITCEGD